MAEEEDHINNLIDGMLHLAECSVTLATNVSNDNRAIAKSTAKSNKEIAHSNTVNAKHGQDTIKKGHVTLEKALTKEVKSKGQKTRGGIVLMKSKSKSKSEETTEMEEAMETEEGSKLYIYIYVSRLHLFVVSMVTLHYFPLHHHHHHLSLSLSLAFSFSY